MIAKEILDEVINVFKNEITHYTTERTWVDDKLTKWD